MIAGPAPTEAGRSVGGIETQARAVRRCFFPASPWLPHRAGDSFNSASPDALARDEAGRRPVEARRPGYRVETWMIEDRPRRVQIWTPEAWEAMPEAARPRGAFYFDGLGYVHVEPPRTDPPGGPPNRPVAP